MPSIFWARLRTSSIDFATFTPPPLPRPPAWICAFTTHTEPPSFCAAATASSTDMAGSPRGVTTPYLRKICLPWYSWMFISGGTAQDAARDSNSVVIALCGGLDLVLARVPLRVIAPDRGRVRRERMAAIDLERLLVRVLQPLPRHRLERCRRQHSRHFGAVGAAAHAAQQLVDSRVIARTNRKADELAVRGFDPVAVIHVRHRVHGRGGIDDGERAIHRDAK